MTKTYKMAYTEVLEIIKHLSPNEIEKIPKETIDFFFRIRIVIIILHMMLMKL